MNSAGSGGKFSLEAGAPAPQIAAGHVRLGLNAPEKCSGNKSESYGV